MIFGLPYEGQVNSRLGAIKGPRAIRNASDCIESYSPFLDRDLASLKLYDDGDVAVGGTGKEALEDMAREIRKRLSPRVKPVFLGGDHSVSYSIVKALSEMKQTFDLVHLDAHFDSQDEFDGDPWSYACWLRRAKGFVKGTIYQFGIRTSTKKETEYAFRSHKAFLAPQFIEGIRVLSEETKGKNVYVSFDIDVLDPAIAPGTSNPVYGGFTHDHIQMLCQSLRGANVIGLDVVEVAPNLDSSGRTSIVAAEIIRDFILSWWA